MWTSIHEANFRLNGGWTIVVVNLAFQAFKWVLIGALFGLGWRLVS